MTTREFLEDHEPVPERHWRILKEMWTEAASKVGTQLGAEVLFQPEETLTYHMFTDHRFCSGAFLLGPDVSSPRPDSDYWHMNADYGSIVIERLLTE